MRVIHRIRVEGITEAADRLRLLLHKAGYLLVADSSASVAIEFLDGARLALDSVDSPLEARIEANLEDLHKRFGCGVYLKQRAGGNRDPARALLTVPPGHEMAEGVALAVLRAIVQVSDQAVQRPDPMVVAPPQRRPWWRFGLILALILLPRVVFAQADPPFQQLDSNTGATTNNRVFVGIFAPSSTGAVAIPGDATNGIYVNCRTGCAGGTTDTDDASIAAGQETGIQIGLTQAFDGSVWRRMTFGTAGSASTQVWTVQGIASGTPVIVGDGAGALNVICDSGCSGAASFEDDDAFTVGTTAVNVVAGLFDDVSPAAATENSAAAVRMTSARALHVAQQGTVTVSATNLDVQSGGADVLSTTAHDAAFGTAGAADAQVRTVQGVASMTPLLVDGSATTQPVSGTVTVTDGAGALNTIIDSGTVTTVSTVTSLSQFAGAAINLGSGTISTGTLRMTVATDDPVNDAAVEVSAAIGATAAAVPASAHQIGGTDGTNLVVPYIDPCQREARTTYVVDIVTATTTEIANAVASEFFFVCSVSLFSAGTNNVAIVEDDSDTCASPTAGLNGGVTAGEGYNFTAQTGIVTGDGSHYVMRTATANRYFCIITSAAVQLSGTITYVSAP